MTIIIPYFFQSQKRLKYELFFEGRKTMCAFMALYIYAFDKATDTILLQENEKKCVNLSGNVVQVSSRVLVWYTLIQYMWKGSSFTVQGTSFSHVHVTPALFCLVLIKSVHILINLWCVLICFLNAGSRSVLDFSLCALVFFCCDVYGSVVHTHTHIF